MLRGQAPPGPGLGEFQVAFVRTAPFTNVRSPSRECARDSIASAGGPGAQSLPDRRPAEDAAVGEQRQGQLAIPELLLRLGEVSTNAGTAGMLG